MKFLRSFFIASALVFMFSGCVVKNNYEYIEPEYPVMPKIHKVPETTNTFVQGGCLYFDERNSNLCGDDLIVILSQIKKLRINEDTCEQLTIDYNRWVEEKKENPIEKESEYSWDWVLW